MNPATPNAQQPVLLACGKKSDRIPRGVIFPILVCILVSTPDGIDKRTEVKLSIAIEKMNSGGRRKGMKAFLGIKVIGRNKSGKDYQEMNRHQTP
jgi:hypothetical protein